MTSLPVQLRAEGLRAGYRAGDPIVSGIDLMVDAGEFIGLIGPNGCGKSTLIRAMTGVLPAMRGRVTLRGIDIASMSRRNLAREFAVLPQETICPFSFSVREFVAMGRHPHLARFRGPNAVDNSIVEDALCRTGAASLAQRFVTELSGGERQRVFIARALAQKAPLMFLDEPTNHLDIHHQIEVFDLLFELSRVEGLALICVTHDLNLAAAYCDRLVLMWAGGVFAQGTPEKVLTSSVVEEVYGTSVVVEVSPGKKNCPRVFPAAIARPVVMGEVME